MSQYQQDCSDFLVVSLPRNHSCALAQRFAFGLRARCTLIWCTARRMRFEQRSNPEPKLAKRVLRHSEAVEPIVKQSEAFGLRARGTLIRCTARRMVTAGYQSRCFLQGAPEVRRRKKIN